MRQAYCKNGHGPNYPRTRSRGCAICATESKRARYASNAGGTADRARRAAIDAIQKLRDDVIAGYGGRCACCGEENPGFLTLDHVNSDGAQERRAGNSTRQAWRKARQEGFPDRYQLLCFNCNCGRAGNGGVCPHEASR